MITVAALSMLLIATSGTNVSQCQRPSGIPISSAVWNTLSADGQEASCREWESRQADVPLPKPANWNSLNAAEQKYWLDHGVGRGLDVVDQAVTSLVDKLIRGTATKADLTALLDDPETDHATSSGRVLEFRDGTTALTVYGGQRLTLYPEEEPLEPNQPRSSAALSELNDFLRAISVAQRCAMKCQKDVDKLLIRLQQSDMGAIEDVRLTAMQFAIASQALGLQSQVSVMRLRAQRDRAESNLRRGLTAVLTALRDRATANRAVAALPKAKELLATGNLVEGWASVAPFTEYPVIVEALPELRATALSWLTTKSQAASASRSFGAFVQVLKELGSAPDELVSEAQKQGLRDEIAVGVTTLALVKLPPGFIMTTPEGRRSATSR